MLTRKVVVFKYGKSGMNDKGVWIQERIKDGTALFHQWGMSYEEFECGPGQYSTAIIEREDGTVENVAAELIKFIK